MTGHEDYGITIGDITLYKEDIQSIAPQQWIRDNIIAFYYDQYLKSILMDNDDLRNRMLVLDPWGVFALQFFTEQEEFDGFIEGNQPRDKDFVFMPINNNQSLEQIGGGSHWSFLLYNKLVKQFWYFDSYYHTGSDDVARKTAKQFLKVIKTKSNDEKLNDEDLLENLKVIKTTRQSNGYDCGIYSCTYATYVLNWIIENGKNKSNSENLKSISSIEEYVKTITATVINNKRKEIRDLLNHKIKTAKSI